MMFISPEAWIKLGLAILVGGLTTAAIIWQVVGRPKNHEAATEKLFAHPDIEVYVKTDL